MSAQSDRRRLFLVDGHAQFFRAYFAIRSAMSSPVTGEPTNMTFGFLGMLLKVMRDYDPDYLAVVIDVSGDRETFRSELYPEYKANREAPPEDLRPQIDRCLDVMRDMAIPVVGEAGVEADDVIATLVTRLTEDDPELEIYIVSKDKDLAQLLSDRVHLIDVHEDREVNAADIFKVEGVEPRHVADMLALIGDSVDNIPGVPGIGPKTAGKLILEYGSLDQLIARLDEIKGKRRETLAANLEQIRLSRQLVELKRDVEVDFDLDAASCTPRDLPADALLATFRELGFRRHQEDLKTLVGDDAAASPDAPDPGSGLLFAQPEDRLRVARDRADYRAVTTTDALESLIETLGRAGRFAFDVETDGLNVRTARLCGISIAIEPGTGWYIPVRSPTPEAHLEVDTVLEAFRPVFDGEAVKVGHNLKFDLNVLRSHGIRVAGPFRDTMVASYIVDATRSSHKLDVLALALLDHACIPIADLIGSGKSQRTFDAVPLDDAVVYAAEDAEVALRLDDVLTDRIRELELLDLYETVEMPLVEVLAELEYNGIRVDADELDRQRSRLSERVAELTALMSDLAPYPFSPDSPKQLAAVLFNPADADPPGMGLKVLKRGKTGPSTDQEVLEKLSADPSVASEIPGLILEYRQLTKLISTYLVALKEAIEPTTGRVHASFNQTVAATGRLSSSDPNLQNIPVRTELGREIRRAFVADPGHVLLTADYSQIELRLLAHLSEDPALLQAFRDGADIHRAVAAEVHGIDPADVTSEQRAGAKMVNFGIIYGVTPYGLARRLGPDVSVEEGKSIIDGYKARFSRIEAFLNECIEMAETHGYVETILKRRRPIPQITSSNRQRRALGERMAINTVVQGSAADLIKLAMIRLHGRLPDAFPEARMILQIHDELVFEVPEGEAESVRDLVVSEMESAMELSVPLVVESAWSSSWIDAK